MSGFARTKAGSAAEGEPLSQKRGAGSAIGKVVAAAARAGLVSHSEVGELVRRVAVAINGGAAAGDREDRPARQATKAEIRASVKPKGLVSFEDGKLYPTLVPHLRSLGMTASDYRTKWGLPASYPMFSKHVLLKRRKTVLKTQVEKAERRLMEHRLRQEARETATMRKRKGNTREG